MGRVPGYQNRGGSRRRDIATGLGGMRHGEFCRRAGMRAAAAGAGPVRLVALGDSLTAGYGLPPDEALPAPAAARSPPRVTTW